VKRGGIATIRRRLPQAIVDRMVAVLPTITGSLATALARAARTPSRMRRRARP
jgi:hypothetical protein